MDHVNEACSIAIEVSFDGVYQTSVGKSVRCCTVRNIITNGTIFAALKSAWWWGYSYEGYLSAGYNWGLSVKSNVLLRYVMTIMKLRERGCWEMYVFLKAVARVIRVRAGVNHKLLDCVILWRDSVISEKWA